MQTKVHSLFQRDIRTRSFFFEDLTKVEGDHRFDNDLLSNNVSWKPKKNETACSSSLHSVEKSFTCNEALLDKIKFRTLPLSVSWHSQTPELLLLRHLRKVLFHLMFRRNFSRRQTGSCGEASAHFELHTLTIRRSFVRASSCDLSKRLCSVCDRLNVWLKDSQNENLFILKESFKRRHISVRALASSYSCIAFWPREDFPSCCQSTRLSLEYPLYVLYLLCPLWNFHESYEHSFLLSGLACYDVGSLVVNATIFQNASPWDRGGWRVATMGSNKNNYGHQRCSDPQSQSSK